jgi:hypothetical protein
MLHPIRRCARPGGLPGILQGDFGAVELGRRQGTHARRAARPLDCRIRLLQSRVPGRRGAACRERKEESH